MEQSQLPIIDSKSLALAADYARDGEFSETDLIYDPARRTVSLRIWKHDRPSSSQDTNEPTNWYRLPLRCLEIGFENVNAVKIDKNQSGTAKHPVGGFRWDERGIIFIDTYNGVTIELLVGSLLGSLRITDRMRERSG